MGDSNMQDSFAKNNPNEKLQGEDNVVKEYQRSDFQVRKFDCLLDRSSDKFFEQIGAMIGQGSFATVHRAKELSTDRDVALKIVRPESELNLGAGPNGNTRGVAYKDVLRAMRLEVQYVEALGSHPNIVKILGTAENCKVFVMERAITDLNSLIKDRPNIPLISAKHWSRHILSAVRYMHDVGVIHLDIKSSNILIFADQTAKLCDFGLARKGRDSMAVDRELVTLWYRAPELLMGDSNYTPKVDEWGVGCVMLEMIIGTAPFKGKPECVCTCAEVTHHNFNSDQLMKIFITLGTPRDAALLSRMACTCHFAKWPVFPRKLDALVSKAVTLPRLVVNGKIPDLEDADLHRIAAQWASTVGGLLSIDPAARHAAHQALARHIFERDAAGRGGGGAAAAAAAAGKARHGRKKSVSRDASPTARAALRAAASGTGGAGADDVEAAAAVLMQQTLHSRGGGGSPPPPAHRPQETARQETAQAQHKGSRQASPSARATQTDIKAAPAAAGFNDSVAGGGGADNTSGSSAKSALAGGSEVDSDARTNGPRPATAGAVRRGGDRQLPPPRQQLQRTVSVRTSDFAAVPPAAGGGGGGSRVGGPDTRPAAAAAAADRSERRSISPARRAVFAPAALEGLVRPGAVGGSVEGVMLKPGALNHIAPARHNAAAAHVPPAGGPEPHVPLAARVGQGR